MHFLLCLAAASLATAERFFSVSAFGPSTGADGIQLHASYKEFHTGLSGPRTMCPIESKAKCPQVHGTLVSGKMAGMASKVPGGQAIFVQGNGQVMFEKAHWRYELPGITNCWVHQSTDHKGNEIINFNDGKGNSGLVLCYDKDSTTKATLWAKTKEAKVGSCKDLTGLILADGGSDFGCWQYE